MGGLAARGGDEFRALLDPHELKARYPVRSDGLGRLELARRQIVVRATAERAERGEGKRD